MYQPNSFTKPLVPLYVFAPVAVSDPFHSFHTFQAISSHFKPFQAISSHFTQSSPSAHGGRLCCDSAAARGRPLLCISAHVLPSLPDCLRLLRRQQQIMCAAEHVCVLKRKSRRRCQTLYKHWLRRAIVSRVCCYRPAVSFGRNLSACSMQSFCAGKIWKRGCCASSHP